MARLTLARTRSVVTAMLISTRASSNGPLGRSLWGGSSFEGMSSGCAIASSIDAAAAASSPRASCSCAIRGLVLEGALDLVHADGSEEPTRAGEAYDWPAGHTASTEEDPVFLEIGPLGPMRQLHGHMSG